MDDTISRLRTISRDCVLRNAAGYNWLVRVKQDGPRYIKPVRFNDTGAAIWRALTEGADEAMLSSLLTDGEEPMEETHRDLSDFLMQLCAALGE